MGLFFKQTGVFFAIFIFCSGAQTRGTKCAAFFSAKRELNLTQTFENNKNRDLVELRQNSMGQWVLLPSGHWMHYQYWGESGPIHLHFEGIGGMAQTSLDSTVAQRIIKKQRLLVIELEGQGLTEVHRRIQFEQLGHTPTREIPFDENVDLIWESLPRIFEQEGWDLAEIESFSGHSYGGQALAGMAREMNPNSQPTLQFLATGVTNFNNRLINPYHNSGFKIMDSFASIVFPQSGAIKVEKGADSIPEKYLEPKFRNDRVQLESMVALTLGSGRIDVVNMARDFPKKSKIQIFTAENDQLLFPMLHWEFAMAAQQAGLKTSLVYVEGLDHYLPQNLTASQANTIERMRLAPLDYGPYYKLNRKGKLTPITEDQADALFRRKSLELWEMKKDELYEYFSFMGQIPKFPDSWR